MVKLYHELENEELGVGVELRLFPLPTGCLLGAGLDLFEEGKHVEFVGHIFDVHDDRDCS